MWKQILKWVVVAVIVASLIGFLWQSDFDAIKANLSNIGLHFFWIILVTFIAQIFGTLSWVYTFPKTIAVSFKKLFLIRYIGEHIGLINPTNIVGGDAFKAYKLEKEGVSYETSISSLLVSRVVMIYMQVFIFIVAALIYLFYVGDQTSLLIKTIGGSIVFIILTFGVLVLSDRLLQLVFFERRGISQKVRNVKKIIWDYYQNQTGRFAKSIFWSVCNFLVGAMEIWLICYFIGIEISYLEALLIDQGVLFLKSFAAFIPGQIGVEEYTNKIMLNIVGITSTSIWISVSILRRARQVFWILLAVVVYYFTLKDGNEKPTNIAINAVKSTAKL